jgi:hypothetical protein
VNADDFPPPPGDEPVMKYEVITAAGERQYTLGGSHPRPDREPASETTSTRGAGQLRVAARGKVGTVAAVESKACF